MKNIKQRMERSPITKIVLINWQDPADSSISVSAIVTDAYTGKVLIDMNWYFDFYELMKDLNERIAEI